MKGPFTNMIGAGNKSDVTTSIYNFTKQVFLAEIKSYILNNK